MNLDFLNTAGGKGENRSLYTHTHTYIVCSPFPDFYVKGRCKMKKQTLITSLATVLFFVPELSQAAVCALGGDGCSTLSFNQSDHDFKLDDGWECMEDGYTVTSCPAGKKSSGSCPYASGYYKECVCDTSVYTSSSSSQCGSLADVEGCTDDHGSYYKCTCDTTIMTTCSGGSQYASGTPSCVMNGVSYFLNAECVTCQSPTILNSSKTACECPSNYKECNSSNNEIGSGVSCSVGDVVKYLTCSCPTSYKQCDLGGEVGAKKCMMNGVDYWSACKTCPNLRTHTHIRAT